MSELDPSLVAEINAIEVPQMIEFPRMIQIIYRKFDGQRVGEPQYRITMPVGLTEDTVQHLELEGKTGDVSILLEWTLREEIEATS